MVIGVPREAGHNEHRVGLNPFAVSRLSRHGHVVVVEAGAGGDAHFSDQDYQQAGAQTVYDSDEVYRRADLVCRVRGLSADELDRLKPGSTVCAFHHLAVAPRDVVRRLMELRTTLIGYEIIRGPGGDLPVLTPFSEMAGHMAVQVAAYLLQNAAGGRGILLGNVPGVPPPTVLIVGAGTAGDAAARLAQASGAHVIVLDEEVGKLRALSHALSGQVVTALASDTRLKQYTAIADVLIGAVLIPGARAPYLITESMVESMKPGSVVIDLSIDQGGCVETSRPTTIESPTYVAHDVVHYCVPNLTSNMARTASRALVNAAMPFVLELAARGVDGALHAIPGLAAGVYLYRGKMVHDLTGQTLGIPAEPIVLPPERNSDG